MSQTKYNKSSFVRFGDDLCQLLLSHLSFEQKFIYECVCRQWQRLIYKNEKLLDINKKIYDKLKITDHRSGQRLNLDVFRIIVKKLSNVRQLNVIDYTVRNVKSKPSIKPHFNRRIKQINVSFSCKQMYDNNASKQIRWPLDTHNTEKTLFDQLIEIIIENCNNLTHVAIDFTTVGISIIFEFFNKFGPTIQVLRSQFPIGFIGYAITKSCQTLTAISMPSLLSSDGIPKLMMTTGLRKIEFSLDDMNERQIKSLMSNNCRLNYLFITIDELSTDERINVLFVEMSKLVDLKTLYLCFKCDIFDPNLTDQLAHNCRQIKSFRIVVNKDTKICYQMISSLILMNSLKSLTVQDFGNYQNTNNSENNYQILCNKSQISPNLMCLRLNGFPLIKQFLVNIDKHFPNLRYINVSNVLETDCLIQCLANLPKLQTVSIKSNKKLIFKGYLLSPIIKSCLKLQSYHCTTYSYTIMLNNRQICQLRDKYLAINEMIVNENQVKDIFQSVLIPLFTISDDSESE